MSLFDRVFEAVDYKKQQARLNKLNKPPAKQSKELEDKMFQVGSYHPSYSEMSMKKSYADNKLDRIKALKVLSKARENLKATDPGSDDFEKAERKRDNAVDAAARNHPQFRPNQDPRFRR